MQRAPIVIASTIAGLALVIGYDPHSTPSVSSTATASSGTSVTTARTLGANVSGSATGSVQEVTENGRPYGEIQVKATVENGKLTDVSVVQMTAYDGRSQGIDDYAVPELVQESLSAGSAQVDTISGATYTSLAYEASLQAALDKVA